MVVKASGNKLTRKQAEHTWDRTIMPFGRRIGLLTGYVKAQEGTSKRTAAGSIDLQRQWHNLCDEMFKKIRAVAKEVLKDDELVDKMMPVLIFNLDEECLHALGKNEAIVGSAAKKKHDNQNASSRYLLFSPTILSIICSHSHIVATSSFYNFFCGAKSSTLT